MNLEAFKSLSSKRQQQLVVDWGISLGARQSRNFHIYLFALEGFYVEVYFFKESGEYGTLKPFDDTDQLGPYLKDIEIGDLLPFQQ